MRSEPARAFLLNDIHIVDKQPIKNMDKLNSGERLNGEQSLFSPDGFCELKMQGDGNLVLYQIRTDPNDTQLPRVPFAMWSSKTNNRPGATVVMQEDGNLVIYLSNSPLWATKTEGNPGSHLKVQDDGNVVIYKGSSPIWSTATRVRPPLR
jgi:hypothetical protein